MIIRDKKVVDHLKASTGMLAALRSMHTITGEHLMGHYPGNNFDDMPETEARLVSRLISYHDEQRKAVFEELEEMCPDLSGLAYNFQLGEDDKGDFARITFNDQSE